MRHLGALDRTEEAASAPEPMTARGTLGARPAASSASSSPPPRQTVRQVLEAAAASGSAAAARRLEAPPLPMAAATVFEWWCQLHRQRRAFGYGLLPLGWEEIDAWARLMRVQPTPTALDLLTHGDHCYLVGLHDGFEEEAPPERVWDDEGRLLSGPDVDGALTFPDPVEEDEEDGE